MHAQHKNAFTRQHALNFSCLYPSDRIRRYDYSCHKHTCTESRNRFHVRTLSLLSWVDSSDSVELLWGAKNGFDVTIYLPDLSGSTLASATFRFYLKHHQTSNLGPGLWKLDLIYCLPLFPPLTAPLSWGT